MSLPLHNRTILITRAQGQAPEFQHLLEEAGAQVVHLPTIEIRPRPDSEVDRAVEALENCDWLMFTSSNAAEIFMDRAQALGKLPDPAGDSPLPKICTVGPATADRVKSYGYTVTLVPELYQAEGILKDFLDFNGDRVEGLRILLPRASRARELLPQALRELGAEVKLIEVYDTVVPAESRSQLSQLLESRPPDLITFTSASTVSNFASLAKEVGDVRQFRCAVIGPITAATAREHGFKIVAQAQRSSAPDLVRAIEHYFQQKVGGTSGAESET